MTKYIIYIILLFPFVLQAHSLPAQALWPKIEQVLTPEELKSFIFMVDDNPQFLTVNKVSLNYFGRVQPKPGTPGLFSLKGNTFSQNPEFPVELGEQFYVSNEDKETFPDGSYRMHLTLTSLRTGKSQNFTSNPIDEGKN